MYEDVSSPTATTTSVMTMAAVAAWEGRKVMTVDVGGAFLHADIKLAGGELVHVELDEIMARFLLELDPSYQRYRTRRGTILVELDRALYGTIQAARCWYDLLSKELKGWGYKANQYDPCVFNKTSRRGEQCTIVLHVCCDQHTA